MHQPDPSTPIGETLSALDDLVREGLVRYVGSSNFTGWQVADADWVSRSEHSVRFISAQNHYSLADRTVEADLTGACERFGVGILPYFPLANGLLTGKYERGADAPAGTRLADRPEYFTPERLDVLDALTGFARERGIGVLDVAIAGLAAQPAVGSVIAGATRPEQVQANAAALSWQPTAEDLAELDQIAPTARGRR
jgi:aryl-alcohol dehydrogenase-like predicted oxidoreductase